MKIENWQFEGNTLAVMPDKLNDIISQRELAIVDGIDIEDAINRRATKFKNVSGKVVTIPLHGFISHKATTWSALGFETSSETFSGWMDSLVNNGDVGAIVIDVDSPGGTALGLSGVSEKIYSMRGKKPIIAVVNDLMASAAYFIGSAADEIVSDPDALTGSIGTISVHMDYSQFLENMGVKPTVITSGKFKGEGNPYMPLTAEAKEDMQRMIDDFGASFVSAVARNRNTTVADVKQNYGQGRVFRAAEAKNIGMIDRIATMENVINDLLPKGKSKSRAKSELDFLKV
jgi:signal peptide peptidase SppA